MRRMLWMVVLGISVMLFALPVAAKTLYVTDQLAVNLRSQALSGAEAVKLLHSDDAMEVLGEQGEYYQVRLADGSEGYFPKRYTTDVEPRSRVMGRLEKKLEQLDGELKASRQRLGAASGELEAEREQLSTKLQETQAQLEALQQQNAQLLNERDAALQKYDQLVADSGNVVELAAERDRLLEESRTLNGKLEALSKENESLLLSGAVKWFLAGAGVLIFGWLLGRSTRRKRGGLSGY